MPRRVLTLPGSGPVRGRETPVANVRAEPFLLRQPAAARLKTAQLQPLKRRTKAGAGQCISAAVGMPTAGLQGRAPVAGAQRARAAQRVGSRRQPGRQRPALVETRRGAGESAERRAASAEALARQATLGSPKPRERARQAEPSVRLQISPEGKVSLLVSPETASPAGATRDAYGRFLPHRPASLACHGAAVTQQHTQAAGAAAALEPCTEVAALGRAAVPGRTAPCDEAVTCAHGRLKRVPGGNPLQVREPYLPFFMVNPLCIPWSVNTFKVVILTHQQSGIYVPKSCTPASQHFCGRKSLTKH